LTDSRRRTPLAGGRTGAAWNEGIPNPKGASSMNSKHAALAVAMAAVLSAPAFAQGSNCDMSSSNLQVNCSPATSVLGAGPVTSSTGMPVTSSTGVTVTPGVPIASVTVTPSTETSVPSANLLPGGAMVQRSSTTVLGGPSGSASGTKSVVTDYWVNVPPGAASRADFQRWQSLR
jgi:hypothetical protein